LLSCKVREIVQVNKEKPEFIPWRIPAEIGLNSLSLSDFGNIRARLALDRIAFPHIAASLGFARTASLAIRPSAQHPPHFLQLPNHHFHPAFQFVHSSLDRLVAARRESNPSWSPGRTGRKWRNRPALRGSIARAFPFPFAATAKPALQLLQPLPRLLEISPSLFQLLANLGIQFVARRLAFLRSPLVISTAFCIRPPIRSGTVCASLLGEPRAQRGQSQAAGH
jgi:hypothetical protein